MTTYDFLDTQCPIETIALILGKKWIPTIIFVIAQGDIRLGELHREIGCSKKVLLDQLNLLLHYKIIENEKTFVDNTIISYYSLASLGVELLPILSNMKSFGCKLIEAK